MQSTIYFISGSLFQLASFPKKPCKTIQEFNFPQAHFPPNQFSTKLALIVLKSLAINLPSCFLLQQTQIVSQYNSNIYFSSKLYDYTPPHSTHFSFTQSWKINHRRTNGSISVSTTTIMHQRSDPTQLNSLNILIPIFRITECKCDVYCENITPYMRS